MHVEPYSQEKHGQVLENAHLERTGRSLDFGVLPRAGFVVFDEEGGFCCCLFLQLTDCSVARLENLLVARGLKFPDYMHAVSLARVACEACAKELGYTALLVTTYPHLCRHIEQNAGYESFAKRFSASYKRL